VLGAEETTQHEAVLSAQHSLDISKTRYAGGVTSYLEVLTAENTLIQNQVTESTLKTRQFAASVELIRALGGGWDSSQLPK
jgi:outer membrane protein TolC